MFKKSLLLLFVLLSALIPMTYAENKTVNVWFFYADYCPHCHKVLDSGVLDNLPLYAKLKMYEISKDENARELFINITNAYNKPAGVPLIVVFTDDPYNGKVLMGDDPIIQNLPSVVNSFYSASTNTDSFSGINDLALVLGTALADSVNPCIMAVLVLLLATLSSMSLSSKKRKDEVKKKMLKVGFVYTSAVFITYLVLGVLILFGMNALFNYMTGYIVSIEYYIKLFVVVMIVVAGLINIKDFFWYGKGISFVLPKKYQLKVKSLAKKSTLPAVISAALIVTIVEFPCSGMMYLGIITYFVSKNLPLMQIMMYLVIYNVIFVLPLVVIALLSTKSVRKVEKARLKYRRIFRLVMGVALLVLAYLIVVV